MKVYEKPRFTILIFGLSLLMIAGLSVCILMVVFMSVDGVTLDKGMVLFLGILITAFSLKAIIKNNRGYSQQRAEEVKNGDEEVVAKWEIDSEQWSRFYKAKYEDNIRNATGFGWAAAALMGLVSGFSLWNRLELIEVIVCIILVSGISFLVGKYVAILKARTDLNRQSQIQVAEIHFAKSSIIYNSKLILVNEFGYRPKQITIQEQFNMNVMVFTIESGIGHRKSSKSYTIPIPSGKTEEANKLVSYYSQIA